MKSSTTTTKTTYIRPYKDINILAKSKQTITTKNTAIKTSTSLYKRLSGWGIVGISIFAVITGSTLATGYDNRYNAIPNANATGYVTTAEYLDNIDFASNASGFVSLIFGEYVDGELTGGILGTFKEFITTAGNTWEAIANFVTGNQSQIFITEFGSARFNELMAKWNAGATPQQIYNELTTAELTFLSTTQSEDFTGLESVLFNSGKFLLVFRDLYGYYGTINQWYILWTMPSVMWHVENI